MLLIMCHSNSNRYAVDSRHVSEVLPRVHLHRLSGSPPWLAGMLIHRAKATPVMDLAQLTEGTCSPDRLSSRIVVLEMELCGSLRQLGVLVERVDLRETSREPEEAGGTADGPAALGRLLLDEQGVFQLVDPLRLVPKDRQAILFPSLEESR